MISISLVFALDHRLTFLFLAGKDHRFDLNYADLCNTHDSFFFGVNNTHDS